MSDTPAGMKIMVTVGGYGGAGAEPITLTAFKNNALGTTVILGKVGYRDIPDEGFAFVTNLRLANYDSLFRDEDMGAAIVAFKEGEGMGTILFDDEAMKYRPRIEIDGVDTKGQKYRLGGDMTNGEIAVLALAHFLSRQRSMSAVFNMSDELMRVYQIRSI